MPDPQTPVENIRLVRQRYQEELMSKANVVGVGIGLRHHQGEQTSEPALVVMVRKKVPITLLAPEDVIPATLDGIPVDVQEVGDLRAL